MTFHFQLLGPLNIEENGQPAAVMKHNKGCALLAYLVVTGETHSREVIADLLWESSSTADSLRNLRQQLHRLKKDAPGLQVTRKQISYHPQTSIIDLHIIENALTSEDISALDEALRLYRGDLMTGFYLEDAPRFNEWLLMARERLRQRVWHGFRRACEAYEAQKRWLSGIDLARHWLNLDNLDESIHRQLMRFLAGDGQVDAAIAQYEQCRQILLTEFDAEPEAATMALAAQLTQTALPSADEVAAVGPLPASSYIPHRRNDDFRGRQKDLLQLANYLLPVPKKDRGGTSAAITGFGGLGKTQLAVEYSFRYGRYYPGGVYWISFADPHNVTNEIAAIGNERGMGLYGEADQLPLADQIGRVQRAWQEPTPRLLIFDNCESEDLFAQWRPVTGGCHILVTSRRGYWDQGLGIMTLSLAVLDRPDSIAVLQQLAPHLSQEDAAAIAAEVGDYPLALHLAGSFLQRYQQVSTAAYLAQLRDKGLLDHPSLQGHGINYSPTGHELHVIRTFAMNTDQLNPEQEVDQMALRLLAAIVCFAPGEPLPQSILRSVLDGENDLLTSLLVHDGLVRLASLGLLQVKGHEVVILHRLLAAYVTELLLTPTLRDNMAAAVETSLIALLTDQNKGTYGLAILPLQPIHLSHIIESLQHRIDRRTIQLWLLWGCHQRDRGSYEEAEHSFQHALQLQTQLNDLDDLEKTELLGQLGDLYNRMGRYQAAQSRFEEYLIIFEQTSNPAPLQRAWGINELGMAHALMGNFHEAQAYMEKAIALYKEQLGSNEPSYAYHLSNLATLHFWRGDYESAWQITERSLRAIKKMLGTDHLETVSMTNFLAECLLCMGRIDEAFVEYTQAFNVLQERGTLQHSQNAYNLTGLGQVFLARSQLVKAQQYLEEGLAIRERIRGPKHKYTAQTLIQLGDLHMKSGDYDLAKAHFDRVYDIRQQEFGLQHPETAESLVLLGEWHLLAGQNKQKAKEFFEQAYTILEKQVVTTHVAYQRVQHNLEMLEEITPLAPDPCHPLRG